MEIGFIPCRTSVLKYKLSEITDDVYSDTLQHDLSLPLSGGWMKGEFSLQYLCFPRVRLKTGEEFVLTEEEAEGE